MAEVEEPQYTTLAERIAALNKQKNFDNPEPPRKRAPPPPPPVRPGPEARSQTVPRISIEQSQQATVAPSVPARPVKTQSQAQAPPPLPRRDTQSSLASQGSVNEPARPTPPPLPSRTPSIPTSPPLPSRQATTPRPPLNGRRSSASSQVSFRSTTSTSSVGYPLSSATSAGSNGAPRKVPPAFNAASLPPLPPSRREREAQAQEAAAAEAARVKEAAEQRALKARQEAAERNAMKAREESARETIKPRQPLITAQSAPAVVPSRPVAPPRPVGAPRLPSRPSKANITDAETRQEKHEAAPSLPQRPAKSDNAPPPVPMASRPSAAQIDAAVARVSQPKPQPQDDCWVCRDWSGPDGVAAQYPRQSLPRSDPVGYLAHHLCAPFPSYTDKARAIFTWFHHNILYDTESFFNKTPRHWSVEQTIIHGKAVCQGYSEVYKAIANRAGLECEMVVGHGKGYGHNPLKKGERPPPPNPDGHAWNAVRIDGGRWKLLDACWGAGHLGEDNQYKQVFDPTEFTKTNDKFGEKHFPKETRFQLRDDGRTISWEEYFIGPAVFDPPTVYTTAKEEGILESSIEPRERDIAVNSGQVVRFQFSKLCEHWRCETHSKDRRKPPLLLLSIKGLDGRKDDMVPIETDGYWHWVDVNARDLGAPGQCVQVAMLTSLNGGDGRGVSAKEFFSKKGKPGTAMAWTYIARWELV